ncbi:MAG TPA: hypothetical protein VKN18_28690 [Blastocatellia bacterium]|nr:hypothetical protein [Blastocatellia bacterium]
MHRNIVVVTLLIAFVAIGLSAGVTAALVATSQTAQAGGSP